MFLPFNVGHEHCQDSPLIVSIMHSCYLARIHCPVHKADSWLLEARIAWDLWRVLFVNDGNFSKRMQDIIGQAGSGAVGGAGSIEATQLGPAASGARVSESDGVT